MFNWFKNKEEKKKPMDLYSANQDAAPDVEDDQDDVEHTNYLRSILKLESDSPRSIFENFVLATYKKHLPYFSSYVVTCCELNINQRKLSRIASSKYTIAFFDDDEQVFYYISPLPLEKKYTEDRRVSVQCDFNLLIGSYIDEISTVDEYLLEIKKLTEEANKK